MDNKPNVLFVCGRNKWRSPTAERVYINDTRINVKSAGVSSKSNHRISIIDIEWANIIIVMEKAYKARILGEFRECVIPYIVNLEIPDEYEYMNEELIELIKKGTEYIIHNRFNI